VEIIFLPQINANERKSVGINSPHRRFFIPLHLWEVNGFLNRGGKVIGASVMTARRRGVDLAVKPTMLEAIARKHGSAMDAFCRETFGYDIDYLTQSEAGHLRAASSVDQIRARIAAA